MLEFKGIEHAGACLELIDTSEGPALRFSCGAGYPQWTLVVGAAHRVAAVRYLDDGIALDANVFPSAHVQGHGSLSLTLTARIAEDGAIPDARFVDIEISGNDASFPMEDLVFPGPLGVSQGD